MSPLICIEEPELGLHPDAIILLAHLLKEASRKTQIVITTHSDILLSELADPVENVLVCENVGNTTAMNRLGTKQLEVWLDQYTLGEVWRNGAIGGNP
jgi:predicted ATPase